MIIFPLKEQESTGTTHQNKQETLPKKNIKKNKKKRGGEEGYFPFLHPLFRRSLVLPRWII